MTISGIRPRDLRQNFTEIRQRPNLGTQVARYLSEGVTLRSDRRAGAMRLVLRLGLETQGQDLIEYALVVALIAFAATVGMGNVANGINTSFSKIASRLASAIT